MHRYFLVMAAVCAVACSSDEGGSQGDCPEGFTCVPDDTDGGGDDVATSDAANAAPDAGGDADVPDDGTVACIENEAYLAQQAVLAGGKINPTGRGEQGAVYDVCNGRVILFGGNDRQPEECDSFGPKNYLGDTWAYSLEYENWYKVATTGGPTSRGRHVVAFDAKRKQMLLFGGRYRAPGADALDPYTLYADMWAFDVNTDTWREIQTQPRPAARTNSAMVYDEAHDRLILFGGNTSTSGASFAPLGDTWTFDLETETWSQVEGGGPSARLFHTMAVDTTNNQVIVYSGGDEGAFLGPFFSDVWGLDLDNLTWRRLWSDTARVDTIPMPRINGQFVEDRERGRMILFGGHDDTALGNDNDMWAFDGRAGTWELLSRGDVYTGAGCGSFCQCADDFVQFDAESPERRQYHTFVTIDEATAVLFGGTGDCGYMDDTWHLDLATAAWTEVHAAEQGIACERTGRQDCVELCF